MESWSASPSEGLRRPQKASEGKAGCARGMPGLCRDYAGIMPGRRVWPVPPRDLGSSSESSM